MSFLPSYPQIPESNIQWKRWLDTFNVVQKTHFRSGNVRKLEAAVHVYSGLASVYVVRKEALGKLCSLLLHSFPKVCSFVLSV